MSVIHWGRKLAIDSQAEVHVSAHDSGRMILGVSAACSTFTASIHLSAEQSRQLAAELVAAAEAIESRELAEAA